jgi:hypothetical protein
MRLRNTDERAGGRPLIAIKSRRDLNRPRSSPTAALTSPAVLDGETMSDRLSGVPWRATRRATRAWRHARTTARRCCASAALVDTEESRRSAPARAGELGGRAARMLSATM